MMPWVGLDLQCVIMAFPGLIRNVESQRFQVQLGALLKLVALHYLLGFCVWTC